MLETPMSHRLAALSGDPCKVCGWKTLFTSISLFPDNDCTTIRYTTVERLCCTCALWLGIYMGHLWNAEKSHVR